MAMPYDLREGSLPVCPRIHTTLVPMDTCDAKRNIVGLGHRLAAALHLDVVSKANSISVAVLDINIQIAVGLIAKGAGDLEAFVLELVEQDVCVVDPQMRIPCVAIGNGSTDRSHDTPLL